MLALVVSMPSGFSEMKKNSEEDQEWGYPSFIPRLPRYPECGRWSCASMGSLVIFVICNNEIEIGSEFLEQKGNILHVLFNQLNGSEL